MSAAILRFLPNSDGPDWASAIFCRFSKRGSVRLRAGRILTAVRNAKIFNKCSAIVPDECARWCRPSNRGINLSLTKNRLPSGENRA
jgi:hypothetical protein